MKKILVYFPYPLQKNPKSGSSVRPKRIVEAFQRYADRQQYELIVISGESQERKDLITKYVHLGEAKKTLFCYMENSTMPYWLTDGDHLPRNLSLDLNFWKHLKKHGVPISLFYRDVYWKFDDMYVPPKGIKAFTPIMRAVYRRELTQYEKVVDRLYLPSLEMNEYVNWKGSVDELPPGMENIFEHPEREKPNSAVFVGGISDQIGIMVMLEAFRKLNEGKEYRLELVCREQEYKKYSALKDYERYDWLTVSHKSGAELKDVYHKADIALIPRKKNTYHDFAVPVKMFEYLSYQLPIVATNCDAQARILQGEGFGVITEANADSFAEGVRQALDPEQYRKIKNQIKENAYTRHSWDARVEKAASDMLVLASPKNGE